MKQIDRIVKWFDALESGEYKQGRGLLGSAETGYCCLGVGCTVLGVRFNEW